MKDRMPASHSHEYFVDLVKKSPKIPKSEWTEKENQLARKLASYFSDDQKKATLMGLGVDADSADSMISEAIHEGVGYWGKGWTMAASTDVGDVSHIAPTAQINTATWPVGVGSHTWQATAASGSSFGMKGMIYAAKILGAAVCDLMTKPGLLEAAMMEFNKRTANETYQAAETLVRALQEEISEN